MIYDESHMWPHTQVLLVSTSLLYAIMRQPMAAVFIIWGKGEHQDLLWFPVTQMCVGVHRCLHLHLMQM